jgi:hypothetical protein
LKDRVYTTENVGIIFGKKDAKIPEQTPAQKEAIEKIQQL